MAKLARVLMSACLMAVLLCPRSATAVDTIIDLTVVPAYGQWVSSPTGFSGIEMRTLCLCRPGHLGNFYIDIVSWYSGPVDLNWTINFEDGSSKTGTTHLQYPGEPSRLDAGMYNANALVSFSFNASGNTSTTNLFDNRFSYTAAYSQLKGPLPGTSLYARAKCVGYVSPLNTGRWQVQWQSTGSHPVIFQWRAFGDSGQGQPYSSGVTTAGGFSTALKTNISCQPAPWDSGLSLTVQQVVAVIPHPQKNRTNSREK